jgi:hypothetical protein
MPSSRRAEEAIADRLPDSMTVSTRVRTATLRFSKGVSFCAKFQSLVLRQAPEREQVQMFATIRKLLAPNGGT